MKFFFGIFTFLLTAAFATSICIDNKPGEFIIVAIATLNLTNIFVVFFRLAGINILCSYPADSGNGTDPAMQTERYYYDYCNITDQTCKEFVYSGCGGNANNFDNLQACYDKCGNY